MAKSPAHAAAPPTGRRKVLTAILGAALLLTLAAGIAAAAFLARADHSESNGDDAALSRSSSPAVHDDVQAPPDGTASAASDAGGNATESTRPSIEERLAALPGCSVSAADLDALSVDSEPFAFACANESDSDAAAAAPALSDGAREAIQAARAPFVEQGRTAAFLLIDLGSGRGIAADADASVYGASSFKAPYALYLCETLLETGTADRGTLCDEGAARAYMDGDLLSDGISSYPLGSLIESSIVRSDNDAFRILRSSYDGSAFAQWLGSIGANVELAFGEWFPRVSVRDMGKIWLHAASYLESGTETATWLDGLLDRTEVSYLRDALAGENATVRDKAGWIASNDAAYNALCDAGLVSKGGRTYLFCIMTSAPESEQNIERLQTLVQAIWTAREDLA